MIKKALCICALSSTILFANSFDRVYESIQCRSHGDICRPEVGSEVYIHFLKSDYSIFSKLEYIKGIETKNSLKENYTILRNKIKSLPTLDKYFNSQDTQGLGLIVKEYVYLFSKNLDKEKINRQNEIYLENINNNLQQVESLYTQFESDFIKSFQASGLDYKRYMDLFKSIYYDYSATSILLDKQNASYAIAGLLLVMKENLPNILGEFSVIRNKYPSNKNFLKKQLKFDDFFRNYIGTIFLDANAFKVFVKDCMTKDFKSAKPSAMVYSKRLEASIKIMEEYLKRADFSSLETLFDNPQIRNLFVEKSRSLPFLFGANVKKNTGLTDQYKKALSGYAPKNTTDLQFEIMRITQKMVNNYFATHNKIKKNGAKK